MGSAWDVKGRLRSRPGVPGTCPTFPAAFLRAQVLGGELRDDIGLEGGQATSGQRCDEL